METPEQFDAILPAGGRITGDFAQATGVEIKALIRFAGETLLSRTIRTLRVAGRIRRIVVIGDVQTREEARACGADGAEEEGSTGPDNIMRGLNWLRAQPDGPMQRILIVTTDLPFLTPVALDAFLTACPADADIAVPIITQHAFDTRFPASGSVYTRLRDGAFTVGSVFLLDESALLRNQHNIERVFNTRKSQWQTASLIGPRIVWRFLTRQLTIADILARVRIVTNCNSVPIMDAPPELAFDIDDYADYVYAARLFAANSPASNEPRKNL